MLYQICEAKMLTINHKKKEGSKMQKGSFLFLVTLLFAVALFATAMADQQTTAPVKATKLQQKAQSLRISGEKFFGTPDVPNVGSEVKQGGDDIDNAVAIPSLPATVTGTTVGYTNDYDEACPNTSTSPDVVYSYTTTGERVHFVSCNSSYWTKLFIYDADTNAIACNQYSDSCLPDYRAAIYDVPLSAGTYYIVVDGWGGQEGEYELYVEARPPVDTTDVHPGLGDNGKGLLFFADEYNEYEHYIYWQTSTDTGNTFSSAVYWSFNNGQATYPSIDYWGQDTTFYGTCVPPNEYLNGAPNYLVTLYNATDVGGAAGSYWDWSSYGWHDMRMVDIACDAGLEWWQWGMQSMIHSTSYTDPPMFNAPHIFYPTDSEGYATISWYNDLDTCNATSCDIDRMMNLAYAVYDHWNDSLGLWEMFARQDDPSYWPGEDPSPFDAGYTYTTGDSSHFMYPAVAAYNFNLVIVGENFDVADTADKDLLCYYSSDGDLGSLTTNSVIATAAAERFPEIQHIADAQFLVTYVQDSALYAITTEDGGMTWGTPEVISLAGDRVVSEYRTADIAESDGYVARIAYEYYTHIGDKGDGSISIRIITHQVNDYPDTDEDGVHDLIDNCPATPNAGQENSDNDSFGDACDNCPTTDNEDQANADADSHGDACDNCPAVDNEDQINSDADSHGDVCDNCPTTDNEDQANSDADSFGDACDNCPDVDNEDQVNSDADSHGDVCDNCPVDDNEDQADVDEDTVGDVCDNCPEDYNPGQEDSNGNGVGDVCDYICGDANGDGPVNILDCSYLIAFLYLGGPAPDPLVGSDVNNDGTVNILDISYLIAYLYLEGPPPNCP